MARIIECVPNCSEGRDKEIIEYIADAVRSVPGVALMDYSSDENHNRSVYTIVGDPDQMGEAAFRFAKACVEKIDMTKHHGEHPRMGAVDVIPFTPVKDVSMEECIELSKKVAQRIWEELKMPVTLYEESASAPHRRNLAAIRKGQFEGKMCIRDRVITGLMIRASTPWVMKVFTCSVCFAWSLLPSTTVTS